MVDRQVLHHVRPRVSHLNYFVNAAPCRMLAWGKSLLNVKSCVSPTGPDHSKNRETVFSDHCHQRNSPGHIKFHVQGRTYQFKALSFGLSTAPMELTVVAKELKLMAIHKGRIIHQYLDDWLVKATSHRGCLRHTLDLVKICQSLGYQFDLMAGRVRPIPDHWQNLQDKILEILSLLVCPVQQFMSDRFTNSHRKAISPRPTS